MTKVLFICYSFAPKNAAGTFRSVHFVKELPKLGYEPIIITTDEDSILRSGGSIDYSISKRLPESTKIIRISDPKSPLINGPDYAYIDCSGPYGMNII